MEGHPLRACLASNQRPRHPNKSRAAGRSGVSGRFRIAWFATAGAAARAGPTFREGATRESHRGLSETTSNGSEGWRRCGQALDDSPLQRLRLALQTFTLPSEGCLTRKAAVKLVRGKRYGASPDGAGSRTPGGLWPQPGGVCRARWSQVQALSGDRGGTEGGYSFLHARKTGEGLRFEAMGIAEL